MDAVASLAALASVVVVDQLTKRLVLGRAELRVRRTPVRPVLDLQFPLLLLLWTVGAGCVAVIVTLKLPGNATPVRLGLACALGGATGNLIDRVRHGAVVDFIKLGRWPVFNLADVGITGGAALALVALI